MFTDVYINKRNSYLKNNIEKKKKYLKKKN